MTDPRDLQHYLDEKIGERNEEEQQAQQRADQQDAQLCQAQDRRRAAIALLTDTIIPFLEESKKDMTGVHPLGWTGVMPFNWPFAGRVPLQT